MRPKIGLLLLYLELYDQVLPELRKPLSRFAQTIEQKLKNQGMAVTASSICRRNSEFKQAISTFKKEGVDALVTLHLAYSPSMESAGVLSKTDIPVIVLDTTPAYGFGPEAGPEEVMQNHGIHGVQDLCNMLLRGDKHFFIEAGHWENSDLLKRVARRAKGALLASQFRDSKIGSMGGYFKGMGDFSIPPEVLKKAFGLQTIYFDQNRLKSMLESVDDEAAEQEAGLLEKKFNSDIQDSNSLLHTVRMGMAARAWMEQNKLRGFSLNFSETDIDSGFITLPFLEAGLAMARGIGYAGEGDVLTACLVGALARVFPKTTFTEMFCPDWKGGSVFLSHMGEANPDLLTDRLLVEKELPFIDTGNPVFLAGKLKPGDGVLVNLAPLKDDRFRLIVSEGRVLEMDENRELAHTIRGWFQPQKDLSAFLEAYSCMGGTHHLALVYADAALEIESFGKIMGWDTVRI